jgi:glutamate 5-kinase
LWLAHVTTPGGTVTLDDGAVAAVVERRLSLLPAGITAVRGSFVAGDAVILANSKGRAIARGIVNYDSDELPALIGRRTGDLVAERGAGFDREVVHRDDMVILESASETSSES